jgi:hypothetical protein
VFIIAEVVEEVKRPNRVAECSRNVISAEHSVGSSLGSEGVQRRMRVSGGNDVFDAHIAAETASDTDRCMS